MSYILEALKRSDRDHQVQRRTNQGPTIRSIHQGVASTPSRPYRSPWVWSAASALAVSLLWLAQDRLSPVPTQALEATPASVDAASTDPAVLPNRNEAAAARVAAPVVSESQERLYELWELDSGERRYIDGLDISMHVYSSVPEKRTILINGRRLREGQTLGKDLQLVQITPQGLVVGLRGRRVKITVASGW